MTGPHDAGDRVGRILTLVGDLLREMGGLVSASEGPALRASAPAQLEPPVSLPSSEPQSAPVAPLAEPVHGEPGPIPVEPVVARAQSAPEPRHAEAAASPPADESDNGLFLVCEHADGKIALPWSWVVGTRLSPEGSPEGFTLSDGRAESEMRVSRVLGLWTRRELVDSGERVRWIASPAEMPAAPASAAAPADPSRPALMPDDPPSTWSQPVVLRAAPAVALEECAREGAASEPRRAWIASPSALARRFLMRHLVDLGFEVHEARDLDDPMLPADLKGVTALFLDESLLEDWKARSSAAPGAPPVILLTVDGALRVPAEGTCPPQGAVLPRPFERSEVERVVRWLCSLRRGARGGGSWEHGDEEDDTWLFADPFGAARAGEHSRS